MDTNEAATLYVRDLDLFVTVQLLKDTPPVLSLRQLCEDHGFVTSGSEGQKPNRSQRTATKTSCNTDNYVTIVITSFSGVKFQYGIHANGIFVTGVSARKLATMSSAKRIVPGTKLSTRQLVTISRCGTGQKGSRISPTLWWMEKFHPVSRKHDVFTHFPKDPNLRSLQRLTKITGGLRAATAQTITYIAEKNVGDLITADHKILYEEDESRNNHRCAVIVQVLATQWIQSSPVHNENITRIDENLAEVPQFEGQSETDVHRQFNWNVAKHVKMRGYGRHNDWNSLRNVW